jgi:hypothetical protein
LAEAAGPVSAPNDDAAAGAAVSVHPGSDRNVFTRRPSQDTAVKFHIARNQAVTIGAKVTGVPMAA